MSPRSLAPTAQANTRIRPKPASRLATVKTAISAAAPAMRAAAMRSAGAPTQRVEFAQAWRALDDPGEADLLTRGGQAGRTDAGDLDQPAGEPARAQGRQVSAKPFRGALSGASADGVVVRPDGTGTQPCHDRSGGGGAATRPAPGAYGRRRCRSR